MYTFTRLLDIRASAKLMKSSSIHRNLKSRIKREDTPKLRTTTRLHMKLGRLIPLHLRICDFCTRVWFGFAPHFAMNIIIGTAFVDLFIHEIFAAERKVMPWYSLPVANITGNPQKKKRPITQEFYYANPNGEHNKEKKDPSCVYIARRVAIEPNTQHQERVTTKLSRLFTIEPHHLLTSRQHVLA